MAATDTIHWRIKVATVAALKLLDLRSETPNVPDIRDNVLNWMAWDENNNVWPAVVVTLEDLTDEIGSGTTEHIFDVLPVGVAIVDLVNPERQHEREPQYLAWRRTIREAFHQTRPLAIVDPSLQWVPCLVKPGKIFDVRARELGKVACSLVLNYQVKLKRTF